MPREEDPSYASWSRAIRHELTTVGHEAVVVGHSVGGTMLVATIAESPPTSAPRTIVLISAPFVGTGGWPGDGFEFSLDLGARLPAKAAVHLFHGLEDQIVPSSHLDLYARAIPRASTHLLPGRDHQLNDDLAPVATVITADRGRATTP
jgi:predicted alpha/beta hydrolase family esterase